MTPDQFQIKLSTLASDVQRFIKRDALPLAANIAVERFKENFETESFFGDKWQEVQRRISGTTTYKAVHKKHPKDTERKILTGRTGNLRRSVDKRIEGDTAIVYSDTVYGKYHNDGEGKLPRRQFIGSNSGMEQEIKEKLEQELDRIFRK
jgi:phage gpG-like protein